MHFLTEKENIQLVFEGKQPEWLPFYTDACARMLTPSLERKLDPKTGYRVDPFGVAFTQTPDGAIPANTMSGNFELEDVTEWKKVIPDINLKDIDWESEAKRIRAEKVKPGQIIDYTAGYIWEELHYMMGFEQALVSLLVEPEATIEALNAFADFWIEVIHLQCKYLKPEMITLMEHMANATGPLLSPQTYSKIIKPVHKRVVDVILDMGAIPCIHCDGAIEPLVPEFIDAGFQAIQPFQVFNDINKWKTETGIIAIGGWDAFGRGNQKDSTEEEVRKSVRDAMDTYGPGGRYVFWGSGITPQYKHLSAFMADEARHYGHAFYNK